MPWSSEATRQGPSRKNVSVNESHGNDWIVTAGLSPGDRVIVSGVQAVREGNPVKAVPWQPPATGAPAVDAPASGASGAAAPAGH